MRVFVCDVLHLYSITISFSVPESKQHMVLPEIEEEDEDFNQRHSKLSLTSLLLGKCMKQFQNIINEGEKVKKCLEMLKLQLSESATALTSPSIGLGSLSPNPSKSGGTVRE